MELNRQHSIRRQFNICRGNSCHEILFRSRILLDFPTSRVSGLCNFPPEVESRNVKKKKLFIREVYRNCEHVGFSLRYDEI